MQALRKLDTRDVFMFYDAIVSGNEGAEIVSRRRVTKAEFDAFIGAYQRPLVRDVVNFADPPVVQYNDFSLGKWPDSVVASYSTLGGDPNDIYAPVPCNWCIAKDRS